MAAPFAPGDVIAGRYRIERVLGQGGMGVVVAARHVHLGEQVAIKFPIAQGTFGRDLGARIVREGRAAARLRGEHVARVMDVGTLDSGDPFIVFELLRGSDLGSILDARGPLDVGEALEHVLQACEGLAEAHSIGIVHRDLKPANLFLTKRPDGTPSIKIIDFGIAKARDANTEGAPAATASFMIFGTPLYMSPEQMRSSKDVDARSDVWSLGAVLHHLLAGRPPFEPRSLPEIYQLAQAGPPRIRSLRPEVPAAVELALLRCMACDPDARFADVAELAEAIAPEAPARAAVCAERARRILITAQTSADEPAAGGSISGDVGTEHLDRGGAARVAGVEAGAQAAEGDAIAPTIDATGKDRPGPDAAGPTSAAAVSIQRETAPSTVVAVKIDSGASSSSPGRRASRVPIAIAAVVLCGAAAATWFFMRVEPTNAPASTQVAASPPLETARAEVSVARVPAAASPGPAVVTPASAELPAPGAATATAIATATATPPLPATSAVKPRVPPRVTSHGPSGHAGPLDDPN